MQYLVVLQNSLSNHSVSLSTMATSALMTRHGNALLGDKEVSRFAEFPN